MKRKTRNRENRKASARRVILNRMFSNFYSITDKTVDDAKNIIRPYVGVLHAQYKHLIKQEELEGWVPDLRSGAETYGYENDENTMYNLQYISDRWNCPFRVRWTLDLINQ
jgi:hypothetical protein